MTTFKPGDNVLVTLGGIDVPAIVSYVWSDTIDFRVTNMDDDITVPVGTVRLDPSQRKWAVGDVVRTAEELTTLSDNTVFVAVNDAVHEWDLNIVWLFGSSEEWSPNDIDYPVTIVYVPKGWVF